jgi:hypothetical protein
LVVDPLFGVRLAAELPFHFLSFPEHLPLFAFRFFDDLVALILAISKTLPTPLSFASILPQFAYSSMLCANSAVSAGLG